ncbi:MAG: hypothetical protein C0404_07925 [Verrucomicrobia bacterium]|nr:hypothetical protein [Verrucomicrobiota bacterium]
MRFSATVNKEVKVTFEPSGRSVYVLPGTVLIEAAARAGYIIETPCGGAGKCGKCVVRITSGKCVPTTHELEMITPARVEQGYRLACHCRIQAATTIEVPESSLFQTGHKILASDAGGTMEVKPAVTKRFLQLKPPQREGPHSDVESLAEALGAVEFDIGVLRSMPLILRQNHFEVTATVVDNKVVNLEPGNTSCHCYGMAFDIGTTTLVGTLVDLQTGADVQVASSINPQTSFGDDVISRIKRCREDGDGLDQLQKALLKAVNSIIAEATRKAGTNPENICEVIFAGNTTMQEILCGINPMALGELPFVPAFRDWVTMGAADLPVKMGPRGRIHVFPQIGGFVGGDTVSGVVATRLDEIPGPALLVDVGTNGEIVLASNGRMTATSVAAGPAFEGARIINGMRGTKGAIEKVVIDTDVHMNVIGNVKPAGICGTGLIDVAAELLRLGIIDMTGRVLGGDELPAGLPAAVISRIFEREGQHHFRLVEAQESATGEPICLYQKDVRELQLANGAIRAGINILLKMAGIAPEHLKAILLAGAFGNFIRRNNAKRIGMLPDIPSDRIRFVGNTASFGAKRALLSTAEREYATRIMQTTRHIDLSLNPDFQQEFSAAMLFPET